MYLLLGCGTAGYLVADRLQESGKELLILDKDPKRVESLKERDFEAVVADITKKESFRGIDFSEVDAALILTTDLKLNKKTLAIVKKLNKNVPVIVRAGPQSTKNDFKGENVDAVIYPLNVVADYAVKNLETFEYKKKFKKLLSIMEGAEEKIAIIVHNSPDPDAIASAVSLKKIIERYGQEADVIYGGEIGHEENRALVNLLGIEMQHQDSFDSMKGYSRVALVDTAIPGQNNILDKGITPDIVIDHHQVALEDVKGEFVDVRPEYGATSTILLDYLEHLGEEIDVGLATILLHALKTDTQDFTRNTTAEDLRAASLLYPIANHELLTKIETPAMSSGTLDVLGEAIRNRKLKGSYLLSNVGFITDRDTLPQAADYLLHLEGVSTVIVYGVGDGVVHLSARNNDVRINLGEVMEKAFGEIGQAGGHATAAAAKISLGLFGGVKDKDALLQLAEEAVTQRFFKVIGVTTEKKD